MQRKAPDPFTFLALRRQYTDPHGLYRTLRAQHPLHFDETSHIWLVTGYPEVTAFLDDERFTSHLSSVATPSQSLMSVSRQMLFMDGELHQRAQRVMLKSLALVTKRLSVALRQYVQRCLQAVCQYGTMDAVTDFAAPISLFTIAHVLGIPTSDQAELQKLERWSDTFGDVSSGYFGGNGEDIAHLETYFRQLIAHKRRTPADDVLSALIEAPDIFPTEDDLIANCMMIFAAGRITTKKALGNGISLLLPHWEQWQTLSRENPRFLRVLGEELLRMVTPTRYLVREARVQAHVMSGTPHCIEEGHKIFCFLEAANRDPTTFDQPDRFQPERQPNKHLAFGYGPHQCPGATLARAEIQIALEELLRLSAVQAQPGVSVLWNKNPNLGGYTANRLQFAPLSATSWEA